MFTQSHNFYPFHQWQVFIPAQWQNKIRGMAGQTLLCSDKLSARFLILISITVSLYLTLEQPQLCQYLETVPWFILRGKWKKNNFMRTWIASLPAVHLRSLLGVDITANYLLANKFFSCCELVCVWVHGGWACKAMLVLHVVHAGSWLVLQRRSLLA